MRRWIRDPLAILAGEDGTIVGLDLEALMARHREATRSLVLAA